MDKKIKACLYLGSYLDTIGFNNGMYEFNFGKGKINNFTDAVFIDSMIRTDFLYKGGFENFDLTDKNASDDTILMLYIGRVLIGDKIDFNSYREQILKAGQYLENETKRGTGIRTIESIKNLNKFNNKNIIFKYQSNGGGNGAAMRACCIGIKFRDNQDKLFKQAVFQAMMTHTHPFGYLGSVCVAFFVKLALDNVPHFRWIPKFLDNYDKIFNICKNNLDEVSVEYFNQFFIKMEDFHRDLKKYLDDDIEAGYYRIEKINELLKNRFEPAFNGTNYEKMGATGLGVIIFSLYFLFLTIKPKKTVNYKKGEKYNVMGLEFDDFESDWNLLFTLSSLNFGDNDTIGIICGNLYGAMYGFENLPKIKYENLEFYDELSKLAENLIKSS